jgi:hypothetical protein
MVASSRTGECEKRSKKHIPTTGLLERNPTYLAELILCQVTNTVLPTHTPQKRGIIVTTFILFKK